MTTETYLVNVASDHWDYGVVISTRVDLSAWLQEHLSPGCWVTHLHQVSPKINGMPHETYLLRIEVEAKG